MWNVSSSSSTGSARNVRKNNRQKEYLSLRGYSFFFAILKTFLQYSCLVDIRFSPLLYWKKEHFSVKGGKRMKYKRKLAPATTFDFAAMETWLSDMAEDGWIPVDFRGEKVKFQQAEPQKRSYRIAIPRYFDTQPTAKQLEEYHQLGWEFICTYRCKGYLLANITEHPQEPYTDPAVQKKNIEELYQEERYLYLAGMVLGTLLFVGLGLLTWHYLGRNIIDPNWVLEFYGPILFLLLAVFNFYELRLLKRLKTSLEQGLPISHEKDYTKKLQLKRISNLIYAILGITLLLPPPLGHLFCF